MPESPEEYKARYIASMEAEGRGYLQLAAFYEKIAVLSAGSIAAGAAVAATVASKIGPLKSSWELRLSITIFGLVTALSLIRMADSYASSAFQTFLQAPMHYPESGLPEQIGGRLGSLFSKIGKKRNTKGFLTFLVSCSGLSDLSCCS